MKIKIVKAPVHLDGADRQKGSVHVVPDSLMGDWFFKALLAAGKILLLEAAKPYLPHESAPASAPVAESIGSEPVVDNEADAPAKAKKRKPKSKIGE